MWKYVTSAAAASGDTTETSIGSVTIPKGARRIVGVISQHVGGATLTTGEAVTGQLRLDSPDLNLAPMQLPIAVVDVLTSGAVAYEPVMRPIDMPCGGNETITGYVTMDMAQTGGIKSRFTIVVEV